MSLSIFSICSSLVGGVTTAGAEDDAAAAAAADDEDDEDDVTGVVELDNIGGSLVETR